MADGSPFITFSRIKDPHGHARITKIVKKQKTQKEKILKKMKKDGLVKTAKGIKMATCQRCEKPNPKCGLLQPMLKSTSVTQ